MRQTPIKLKYVNEMPAPLVIDNQHNLRLPAEKNVDRSETLTWDGIEAGITEIILGLLLLAALIGFALVCREGVGYVYDVVFSVAPR